MNKHLSIIIAAILVGVIGYIAFVKPDSSSSSSSGGTSSNVVVRDGVQYVTVTARGGYRPSTTNIKSGIPTTLIMETNNTYDCSLALVVRSVGYRAMLPASGETEIDLGTPKPGQKIQ